MMTWIVLRSVLPRKRLIVMITTTIHAHADAGGDELESQAIRHETETATEMRVRDARNVAKKMKKVMNLARKYDRPTQTTKLTKKAHDHDHDHAAADVAGVAEAAIVMRAETENRLPITMMTPC